MRLFKIKNSLIPGVIFPPNIFISLCSRYHRKASLVLTLFYFLYNFKYIKVYFHRPQEMGRSHRAISLPTKKKCCIFW